MTFDPPYPAVRAAVRLALEEDMGPLGDITAALLPHGAAARAELVPRTPGTVAGRAAATEAFAQVDSRIAVEWYVDDGDRLTAERSLATVRGPLAAVLTAERTALNFLCHLSGIATLTRRYVDAAAGRCRIRDTRKTTPGLRSLEKAAVRAGGGTNHRGSLSDGILVKDNHLAGSSVEEVVRRARDLWPGRAVQVECDTPEQAEAAATAAADLLLLDNMSPGEVEKTVSALRRSGFTGPIEVSGGVDLGNVSDYAAAGADLVSVGALTHSAPTLDIGLDVVVEVD